MKEEKKISKNPKKKDNKIIKLENEEIDLSKLSNDEKIDLFNKLEIKRDEVLSDIVRLNNQYCILSSDEIKKLIELF